MTIEVTPATYTENDTISGGSERSLTIEPTPGASGTVTLDGGAVGRVLTVDVGSSQTVNLDSLTITGGLTSGHGAGIYSSGTGTLALTGSTVADNTARGDSGTVNQAGGTAFGGGISSEAGTLDITDSTITDNTASAGNGGAGADAGAGVPTANTGGAGGNAFGAGIAELNGQLTLDDSTVSGNVASGGSGGRGGNGALGQLPGNNGGAGGGGGAGGEAIGGGLLVSGATVTIQGSTITANQATAGDGGLGGAGGAGAHGVPGTDGGGTPGGTGGTGGDGGNGANGGAGAVAFGGGVAELSPSTLGLQSSTFDDNDAAGGRGGAGGAGGTGGVGGDGTSAGDGGVGGTGGLGAGGANGGASQGGAIYAESSVTAQDVTVALNSSSSGNGGDGGVGGTGALGGAPGNGGGGTSGAEGDGGSGSDGGAGGTATGGGIHAAGAALQLLDSTITGNAVPFGANGAAGQGGIGAVDGAPGTTGAPGSGGGGGLLIQAGSASVGASILAGNEFADCQGTPTDLGYNLTEEAQGSSSCGFTTANHDVMGVANPVTGSLQENGGPTHTVLPASPSAIAIPNPTTISGVPVCPRTDQRGVAGPIAGQSDCTIGATEDLPGQPPALSSGATSVTYTLGAAAQPNWPAALTFSAIPSPTVTESGALPSGAQFSAAAGSGTFDEVATLSGTPTQTGIFPLTLTAGNGYPALNTAVRLTVDQTTSTAVAIASGTPQVGHAIKLQATVRSEVALKGGSVAFSDTLGAISGCSSQPLTAQSASTATASCTSSGYAAAGSDLVTATFSGDAEDLSSSGSQTIAVAALPVTTTTPVTTPVTPPTPRPRPTRKPSLRARLTSKHPKNRYGWWTAPVTVHFTCSAGGGKLAGGCPKAVRIESSGRNQQVHETIRTTDGRRASITVKGINIDLSRPGLRIVGPDEYSTYAFTAPRARCHASDRYSGVRSCVLVERRIPMTAGYKIVYHARAVSGSGTVRYAGLVSFVTTINLSRASLLSPDYWDVTSGGSYVLQVMSRTKPTYFEAAPGAVSPTGPYDTFFRAGSVNGVPIWDSPVRITRGFKRFHSWTIAVQIGNRMIRVRLQTRYS